MRIGIHHVLIHEALGVHVGAPRVCPNCTHLVPTMAFCPQCGVADRAVARPHRRAPVRRSNGPLDVTQIDVVADPPLTDGPEETP